MLNNLMSTKVFSVKNVETVMKSFKTTERENLTKLTEIINSNFENIIIKPIEETSLIHLQFGHPLKVQSSKSAEIINQNISIHKPEVNSIIIDTVTCKTLTVFDLIAPIADNKYSK
jgi:hypothetical protein